jgi:hypothetical protein
MQMLITPDAATRVVRSDEDYARLPEGVAKPPATSIRKLLARKQAI